QAEIGFFGSRDPMQPDKLDLVRREAKTIDLEPTKGGVINVLCENIAGFDVHYLDPIAGTWIDSWDSTQAAGQYMRLPLQVKIILTLNGARGGLPLRLMTKTPLGMQSPLSFAIPKGS